MEPPSSDDVIKMVTTMRDKAREVVKESFEKGMLSAVDESQLYHQALSKLIRTDVWKKNFGRWRAADGS